MKKLDEDTLLAVFEGVPQFEVAKADIEAGIKAVDLFTEKAAIFPSKGEMRKLPDYRQIRHPFYKLKNPFSLAFYGRGKRIFYLRIWKMRKNPVITFPQQKKPVLQKSREQVSRSFMSVHGSINQKPVK